MIRRRDGSTSLLNFMKLIRFCSIRNTCFKTIRMRFGVFKTYGNCLTAALWTILSHIKMQMWSPTSTITTQSNDIALSDCLINTDQSSVFGEVNISPICSISMSNGNKIFLSQTLIPIWKALFNKNYSPTTSGCYSRPHWH